jgi:hypothetical protein
VTVAVLRFELERPVAGGSVVSMPKDARVVSVGSKDGKISVWAECPVPATGEDEPRRFRVLATGIVVVSMSVGSFLGTVEVPSPDGGTEVRHVYEAVYA